MTTPPQPPHGPQPVYLVVPRPRPRSALATAALAFGLVGMCLSVVTFGVPSALAVAFGHAALRDTRSGERSGRTNAQAGLVLGYVILIPLAIYGITYAAGIRP